MRLVRFLHAGVAGCGYLLDDSTIASLPGWPADRPLAADGLAAVRAALTGERLRLADVALLAPLVPVRNVFCLGRNYAEHARENLFGTSDIPSAPVWFTKATTAVTGPGSIEVARSFTGQLDYEGELAVVIGERARGLTAGDALRVVFGYTILNDLSARDVQNGRGGQYFLGKSFDGAAPCGPWLVTRDEIDDPQVLRLRTTVNGELRQNATTADMIFPIAEALADLSRATTLLPGDIIATGTPAGVGMGARPPRWLADGDVVEITIDGLGTLATTIRLT